MIFEYIWTSVNFAEACLHNYTKSSLLMYPLFFFLIVTEQWSHKYLLCNSQLRCALTTLGSHPGCVRRLNDIYSHNDEDYHHHHHHLSFKKLSLLLILVGLSVSWLSTQLLKQYMDKAEAHPLRCRDCSRNGFKTKAVNQCQVGGKR